MNESIGVFTFEGGKGVSLTKGMLKMYDDLGFSCYSTSRAGLFKVWHCNFMLDYACYNRVCKTTAYGITILCCY
jgi:hypothetical protein